MAWKNKTINTASDDETSGNESLVVSRRECMKLGAVGFLGDFGGLPHSLGTDTVQTEVGYGFGGLPALDEQVLPYFNKPKSDTTPTRMLTSQEIQTRFDGADTYTIPVDGDYLFVDIIREGPNKTAAAAILADGDILEAKYLGAGTTRLLGLARSVDDVDVHVFNLDANAGTYFLTASEPEQRPYDGQWDLPGRIEAEDYDTGGSGVAYSDTTEQNMGGYRSGAVDLEATSDEGGGYNLAWTEAGEWTEYTVRAEAGTYDIDLRVASYHGDGRIRLSLDGEELGVVDVPKTGGHQNWETITISNVELADIDGSVLRVESVEGGHNLNWVEFNQSTATQTPTPSDGDATEKSTIQSPYRSEAWTIPGTIQVEDYDTGGEGIAYSDTTEQNMGGYRDEAVDLEATSDEGGGYNLAWTEAGEWTEYTVDTVTGTYEARLRVASYHGDGRIQLLLDGEALGTVDVPESGGHQNWQTVSIPDLTFDAAENRVLRVESVEGGHNLNWIEFVDSAAESGEEVSAPEDWGYGAQGYGEGPYGGAEA